MSVVEDVSLLAEAHDWETLRAYFTFWQDEDELAEKVVVWCHFFLDSFFTDKTPPFHYDLIKRFFSSRNEYVAAPRGFSKTSLVQGCIAFACANKLRNFIVLIEKSFTEASEVLSAVRGEFADNPMILEVYGRLIGKDEDMNDPEKAKDTQGDVLIQGVRLRAKGFNSPIRGLKSQQFRPDLIILDDVEEDEHIRNEEQRRKGMENYTAGVIPALDIGGSAKMFGTILHNDSLLKNLIDQHQGVIYAAFDLASPSTSLLWPERWTLERLMEKKEQMESEGFGSGKFSQEFLNEPVDDATRRFRWEWMQGRFKSEDNDMKARNRYIAIDVADAKGETNDWTALVVVDWDSENVWRVVHAKQKRVDILELIEWIFEAWQYWKPNKVGVEKNAFAYQIQPLLKQKSEELGVYPVVEELNDGGRSKEARIIGALQGRLESGKILFRDGATDDTNILIGQAYDFPRGKHDDLLDALAYISEIGQRPFIQGGRDDLLPAEHREFYAKQRLQKLRQQKSIIGRL
ncbi:MAG: hypothetical protein WC763_05145 [Candidatus Paceibacterota bacterium]|jgi:hypothetical protein